METNVKSPAFSHTSRSNQQSKLLRYFKRHWLLYVMLIPGLVAMIVYRFLPYYGIQIAFRDYNLFAAKDPLAAITASKWVGWKYFSKLFGSSNFSQVLRNTLIINGLKIIVLYPIPIIFAILLKEVRSTRLQHATQTLVYIPYFFSWVIIYGIFSSVLGTYGMVNSLAASLGLGKTNYFSNPVLFRWVLVFTDGWKTLGYNTVIYLAAILAVDPCLYEAARIDGANKWKQIWYVTIPDILPTLILMLILKVGHILDNGFEQVLVFYNPAVYDTSDIIQTYVYRMGIGKLNFSLSTALGLFNSVVAFLLIVGSNAVSRKTLHRSIW